MADSASGAAGADGQPGRAEAGPGVTYPVFDLLWLDGRLLTGLPYTERRRWEVSFLGWESGRLRHPAYAGLTRLL
jgi:hypothetical protein